MGAPSFEELEAALIRRCGGMADADSKNVGRTEKSDDAPRSLALDDGAAVRIAELHLPDDVDHEIRGDRHERRLLDQLAQRRVGASFACGVVDGLPGEN